eukprot:1960202-Amphidinium_carterae.1
MSTRAEDVVISGVRSLSQVGHVTCWQILEIAEHGASCRGWHEHVWHGSACWENHCHLERGICTGNA